MRAWRTGWGRFALQALVIGVVVFAAIRVAKAMEGHAGVAPRSFLTVAGTLTGVPSTPTPGLVFTLHKGTASCVLSPMGTPFYDGLNYSAQIDYSACADPNLFDGSNINVDVAVNGMPVVADAGVNPVPYAQFAAVAGIANQLSTPTPSTRIYNADMFTGGINEVNPSVQNVFVPVPGSSFSFPAAPGSTVAVFYNTTAEGRGPDTTYDCSACLIFDGTPNPCVEPGMRNIIATLGIVSDLSLMHVYAIPLSSTLSMHTISAEVAFLGTASGSGSPFMAGDECEIGGEGSGSDQLVVIVQPPVP